VSALDSGKAGDVTDEVKPGDKADVEPVTADSTDTRRQTPPATPADATELLIAFGRGGGASLPCASYA
jgi:hypothetical protein